MFGRKPDFDRLLKVLWREGEPDKIPYYEHFVDHEMIEAIIRRSLPRPALASRDAADKRETVEYLRGLVYFYSKLGYDYIPLELPISLARKTVATRDTAYLNRGLRTWQDEHRGIIETREDFEAYPWPDPEEAVNLSVLDLLQTLLPSEMKVVSGVGGGVLEHVMWMMGTVPFCMALYRDPRLVKDMFMKVGSLIYEVDKAIADHGCVGALRMGDDMGYRKGTMVAPSILRKYVFPWQKKCADLAHRAGMPFILHSCGNLEAVMEDLINYVGIDAKHSFEDAIMPVWEAKRLYGDKIAILGGVDVDKLARLNETSLRKYVRKILKLCAPGGGYALGSGNTITNYVKPENYLAMLEEGEKYSKHIL
ncbi:MAG: uroporphyrinogen-III decarboxylase-like protein [Thermoprotei archaeon]|nr:MAG: uroporphyrinogen-III decarboxylase-like protein [Thermoprotei archaeon]